MSDGLPLSGPSVYPEDGISPGKLVVMLHGYGADGNDLITFAQFWKVLLPDALFVAPNAHERCEMNPAGFQWFAIDTSRAISRTERAPVATLILDGYLTALWEKTGLGPEDTLLAGFSQGAMMALYVGLRLPVPPLAIVCFSGALISAETLPDEPSGKPPVCLAHGQDDQVVPVHESRSAEHKLKELGYDVRLHVSPGAGHTITQEGFAFASQFIHTLLDRPAG